MISHFIIGSINSKVGSVPLVSDVLSMKDLLGTFMVRLSINRGNYQISPGLYAIGNPTEFSDVFVTANYKLSFDHLRKNLHGIDAWILVLDTRGINVWCAAGKGTFGTRELVNRIRITRLAEVVSHRRIIVPQLGAVGVSSHEVKEQTENSNMATLSSHVSKSSNGILNLSPNSLQINRGFQVLYGPVKARHIGQFVKNSYLATPEMRRVTFTLTERAVLIPVDFLQGKFKLLIAFAIVFLLSGLNNSGLSFRLAIDSAPGAILNLLVAYMAGIVIMPLTLPYLPGRSFAFKGFITGILGFIAMYYLGNTGLNYFENSAWMLIMGAVSSFVAMNFTGSSTYTSLSGVKKEMKFAIPLQITLSGSGITLFIIGKLF